RTAVHFGVSRRRKRKRKDHLTGERHWAELRMDEAGEDLGALDEARPRSIEVGAAVDDAHAPRTYRGQGAPLVAPAERVDLALGLRDRKPAGHQYDDLRRRVVQGAPRRHSAGLARRGK